MSGLSWNQFNGKKGDGGIDYSDVCIGGYCWVIATSKIGELKNIPTLVKRSDTYKFDVVFRQKISGVSQCHLSQRDNNLRETPDEWMATAWMKASTPEYDYRKKQFSKLDEYKSSGKPADGDICYVLIDDCCITSKWAIAIYYKNFDYFISLHSGSGWAYDAGTEISFERMREKINGNGLMAGAVYAWEKIESPSIPRGLGRF